MYEITWSGLKIGSATISTIRDDREINHIKATVHSADWVTVFYKVDNIVETILAPPDPKTTIDLPMSSKIALREGKLRQESRSQFNHALKKATYTDLLSRTEKTLEIQKNTFDPLSGFFYLRTLQLEPGKSVFLSILEGRRVRNIEMQVLRKERLTTKYGTFDTVVISPLLKSDSIFNKKGPIHIWLTDDLRKIPVQVRMDVPVGHVTAVLTKGHN